MDQRLQDPAVAAPPDWRGLAQPEPEVVGPTDEELLSIAADCFAPVMVHFARTVLARWGRPAPAPAGERQAAPVPVAVSEPLPSVEVEHD